MFGKIFFIILKKIRSSKIITLLIWGIKIKDFHHRQPVILEQKDISDWIEESYFENKINSLDIYQVSTQVNNPSNNLVENIEKIQ